MLHAAPTSETKAETAQSKSQAVPQPERELHPHLLSLAGPYASNGRSGVASGGSPNGQRRQALAGMQSMHGNQAVLRMLHSPQQVARMVPLRPSQGMMLQRKCACGGSSESEGECAECKEKHEATLQRSVDNQSAPSATTVPPIVHDVLSSPGHPLDAGTRAFMEPRFGHDFSQVRVHTDERAAKSARAVNALAYTVGRDVVFGTGQYSPGTSEGRRLMAHELTHVVQQKGHSQLSTVRLPIGEPGDVFEMGAETMAERVMSGKSASAILATMPLRESEATLRTYYQEDCSESDLRTHIRPADGIARQMVAKVIRVLSASPVKPVVTPLLTKYFVGTPPDLSEILAVYNKINDDFNANGYTYECEDDCEPGENGYVYNIWTDIHLCMNNLRGRANDCIARTMVHEFSHYSGSTDHPGGNCYNPSTCSPGRCPASVSADDALDNAYAYGGFAYELYPMSV